MSEAERAMPAEHVIDRDGLVARVQTVLRRYPHSDVCGVAISTPEGGGHPDECTTMAKANVQVHIDTEVRAVSGLLGGVPIFISSALPVVPTFGEDIRRRVRHGLGDVLDWLGEEVGPTPGEPSHMVAGGGRLLVSRDMYDRLRIEAAAGGSAA